jgi:hypothetical protein
MTLTQAEWSAIYMRLRTLVHPSLESSLQESLSKQSKRFGEQKPSKEVRELMLTFGTITDDILETQSLRDAASVIAKNYRETGREDISDSEMLERIENHAEGFLNDDSFVGCAKNWPGLKELQRFRRNKKWWRRPQTSARPTWRPLVSETSLASSSAVVSGMDTTSVDLSDDMETPEPSNTHRAKKGKSVLRPRMSMSMTPATPTRDIQRDESESSDLFGGFADLTNDDDEVLSDIPPKISKKMSIGKFSKKRKSRVLSDDSSSVSKRIRKENDVRIEKEIQFGRGRPPLTTVKVRCLPI